MTTTRKTKHKVGDGWVTLREVRQLPERLRRPILVASQRSKALREHIDTPDGAVAYYEHMLGLNDSLALVMVETWSFGDVVDLDTLRDLTLVEYDAIQALVTPLVGELQPNFEPTPEADSPTGTSAE